MLKNRPTHTPHSSEAQEGETMGKVETNIETEILGNL